MKGILTIIGGQKTPLLGPGKPSDQSISQPLPTIGNENGTTCSTKPCPQLATDN
jgi:hypothetical protein